MNESRLPMNKTLCVGACAALAALGQNAQAQEISGRVISSTPVIQQVPVPRTICSEQPVAVQQQRSGAGAVIGAIAGAALGNAIGAGSGRAAATALGAVGGAAFGDRVEGGGTMVQNMQSCTTQTFYENRTVAYNVSYEYGGRQYTVQMPNDPGPTVRLQVTPVSDGGPVDSYPENRGVGISAPPGTPIVSASSTPVYPAYSTYPAYPAYPAYSSYPGYPAYSGYPAYYPAAPAYYPPVGISLGFGYVGGSGWRGHHHDGGHGHWR
jgi:uncharacterized protein YcfJ